MISIKQFRRFFLTISLAVGLMTAMMFSPTPSDSLAATLSTHFINQRPMNIATMNRIEAATKNIEGKAQEAIGNMTGDPKNQMMGKAKQMESQGRNAAEDVKDRSMDLKKKAKVVKKDLEGTAKDMRNQ